jgi:hypothetical protein
MPSPIATGGGGENFQAQVGAFYLTATLVQATPRLADLETGAVVAVRFQRRDLGDPLDDLIATVALPSGERATLSLQIKRSVTFTARNKTFAADIKACWETFDATTFKPDLDRFGIACGTNNGVVAHHLEPILTRARESASAADFFGRQRKGHTSARGRQFVGDIRTSWRVSLANRSTTSDSGFS